MNIENEIREIRNQLRLAMNGVASTSMREKGIKYKLNFGVSIPDLKEIASTHKPDGELAKALWKEDIREFKILASYLQPANDFSHDEARYWIKDLPYMEVAEACSRNLFSKIPKAEELAIKLLAEEKKGYNHCISFLILSYWFNEGKELNALDKRIFLTKGQLILSAFPLSLFAERQSVLNAFRCYGLQSKEQAKEIMNLVAPLEKSEVPEQNEMYKQLKFEFEYSF